MDSLAARMGRQMGRLGRQKGMSRMRRDGLYAGPGRDAYGDVIER